VSPTPRRVVLAGALALATALTHQALAQPAAGRPPRVVIVNAGDERFFRPLREAFLGAMRDLGQAEGKAFELEVLYGRGEPASTAALIREAAASAPAVLVVAGLSNARNARDATKTVPVVVATGSDLVDAGIVASFARPGGNITGLTDLADQAAVKRLELLKEILPRLSRLALLNNPDFPAAERIERRVGEAADTLGITVVRLHARDRASLTATVDSLGKLRAQALLIGGDSLFASNAAQIIERANAQRVPVAHYWPGTAEAGALFSHQADIAKNYERAAYYATRILQGARPADLPVEQPARYEFVLNRRMATSLGVTIPPAILLRADRVID
jgi:putative ABC transport system substrate-binding protein